MATKKTTSGGLKVTTDSSGKITGASDSKGSYSVDSSGKATPVSSSSKSSPAPSSSAPSSSGGLKVTTDASGKITGASDAAGSYNVDASGKASPVAAAAPMQAPTEAPVKPPVTPRLPGETITDYAGRINQTLLPQAVAPSIDLKNLVGTRSVPGQEQIEYFNKQTGQGFANEGELFKFTSDQTKQGIGNWDQFNNLYNAPATPGAIPPVQTSEVARAAARKAELERIKAELTGGLEKPGAYKPVQEYDRLRKEQGVVKDEEELAAIQNEALMAKQELRQFASTAGQGVSEGGRIGAVTEAERNASFRLEGLAIREQGVLARLNSKNSYIDTAMKLGLQDYQTARNEYEFNYNNNLRAIDLYNQELDDQQKDALTAFTTISNLISESGMALTPGLSTQLDSLALQAGLPAGVFQAAMSGLQAKEKLDNIKIAGDNVYMWTTGPDGTPQLKLIQHVAGLDDSGGGGGGGTGNDTVLDDNENSTGQVKKWIIANKRANPDVPYYELWGRLSDELEKKNLNPANYDKVFWEVLHPEGLTGYAAEQKKKKEDPYSHL